MCVCVCWRSCCTRVEDRRPVPDVHSGRGLLRAQQLTDDRRGHHTGRVTDLQRGTGSISRLELHQNNITSILSFLLQFSASQTDTCADMSVK